MGDFFLPKSGIFFITHYFQVNQPITVNLLAGRQGLRFRLSFLPITDIFPTPADKLFTVVIAKCTFGKNFKHYTK